MKETEVTSSITVGKLLIVGAIISILLIANCFTGLKMKNRRKTAEEAQSRIDSSVGGSVNINGPYIVIPENQMTYSDEGKIIPCLKNVRHNASSLKISTQLETEKRKIGIYSEPIFSGEMNMFASFSLNLPELADTEYSLKESLIILEFDERNIMNKPEFILNNKSYPVEFMEFEKKNCLCAKVPLTQEQILNRINLNITIKFLGAEKFCVDASSDEIYMTAKSDWSSPGFTGYDYLPSNYKINEDGFTAEWAIPFVNSNLTTKRNFGFTYADPVNLYKKLDRSNSYAFLFIIVPFVIMLMFELLAEVNLHPLQYLLSGAASIMFFLLLLSVSEHISFNASYVIASAVSGIMISLYIGGITKKKSFALIMAASFALLYGVLFLALQSEDYALLIGTIFAFIIVAVLMFLTKNLKYTRKESVKEKKQPAVYPPEQQAVINNTDGK